MANETHETDGDVAVIDTRDDYELRRWALALEATFDEIRDAVMTVGNDAAAVRRHLGR
jgi:hypothetical protein